METSSTSLSNPQISKFNGKNYNYWAITMKTLFSSQDIWDLVENGLQEPADAVSYNILSQAKRDFWRDNTKKDSKAVLYIFQAVHECMNFLRDNRKKDSKGLLYIFQVVHESIFPKVVPTTKSRQAWDTLQTIYQGMAKVTAKWDTLQTIYQSMEKVTAKWQMLWRDFETLCMKES